ncbi:phosphate ABC transporter permease subunit PstC [Helicobacter anatolicus]|uniref:phosphate ABC transporter permease subunit PstC n=1 Tax=Helicobacter anatolicus TaxID=2905874 RepID=UPI001E561274|nr:phosphate ABC transporter permease subunit PstC [Helicobacter anatolicus]MCE3037977.1 phosphate ABC transporter permease subunit PstC [Helicobacter anatolicus]
MLDLKEKLAHGMFLFCACICIICVALICIFLFANGIPAIKEIGLFDFLFGVNWAPLDEEFGIFPMIIGSIYVTAGAIFFGVIFGVLCAIFLSKFCPLYLNKILNPIIHLMAGIPSIVYGFFGLVVIVPLVQYYFGTSGKGILSASLLLGIMILPTIISISKTAIDSVPTNYYEGALALGITHERSVFFILLPAAKSGILTSIILGIGRAIGETMAVVMIAGNQAIIPQSILDGTRTLTANIVLEMGYATDLHRNALLGTAVVLFVFILMINISFSLICRRKS